MEGGHGTRVGTDGSGLTNVWRQQLMQFKNVSIEVSSAIVARYPSPRLLHDVNTGFIHFCSVHSSIRTWCIGMVWSATATAQSTATSPKLPHGQSHGHKS